MPRHFLAIAVILTVTTGCDNVAWGGIEVSVDTPESDVPAPSEANGAEAAAEPEAAPEPLGPLLLAGVPEGDAMSLVPVAVLGGEGLEPLPSDSARVAQARSAMAAGSEWVLFASGVRVGTATVTSVGTSSETCGLSLEAEATPQLLPAAATADRLLALPATGYGDWPFEDYAPMAHTYNQRVASLDLGRTALPRVGAPWPANGMLPVRRDIQAFRPTGDQSPSFAASFVVDDMLDTSPPSASSYALFLVADQGPQGFRERYLFHQAAGEPKAAPRFFGHLDWDRDGTDELLLEVFGEGRRGYVALERESDGTWRPAFASACPHTAGATER